MTLAPTARPSVRPWHADAPRTAVDENLLARLQVGTANETQMGGDADQGGGGNQGSLTPGGMG